MDGGLFWALAVTAAVLVGFGKGGLPVVAMLSVPLLALVISPVTAAGLLLPVYVVSDLFGLYAYRRDVNWRLMAILAPATTVGVALGWATAAQVPEWVVSGLIGLIGVVFALNLIIRPQLDRQESRPRVAPGLFWGTIAGFTSFVSHSGGPPYQVYVMPLGLRKTVYAGTTTVLFAYVNAVKLIPYWALGQFSSEHLKAAAILSVPASVAVIVGVRLVRILPEKLFFHLVTWALLLVSVKLVWQAVAG